MNIIKDLTRRIEEYRVENKNPCKSYATEAAAEKALEKICEQAAIYYMVQSFDYVVFYNEAWGRWVGAINMSAKAPQLGGYVGFFSDANFYTF